VKEAAAPPRPSSSSQETEVEEPAAPPPDWRLEASGAREDTMFRVDVVAYAPQAKARATWRESSQWNVAAEAAGEPMKRLVCGPARVEEAVDTGEVVVRFAVYFEPPTGKANVDLKVAPPGGSEERTSLAIEEADTWHKVETAGGPRAFGEGAFAAAGGAVFAVDGRKLLRSNDGGKTWEDAPTPSGEAAQSIVGAGDGLVLATSGNIYESADGAEWRKLSRPLPRRKLVLAANQKRIVAVVDRRVVFCSAGGKTWQRPRRGLPGGRVLDVAVAGKVVLVSVAGRGGPAVYRSADGCKSFKVVGRGGSVAADDKVAVAALGETAWRSDDDGATWEEIPAPGPPGSFHLVVVDGKAYAALLDQNFPAALVRLERSSWQRIQRGGLPRVKAAPTLLPAGNMLYLVADKGQLWSLDKRLVR
jgi:hypothetical protein